MAFHYNPEHGEVGPCKATKACPFGMSIEGHPATADGARELYEAFMATKGQESLQGQKREEAPPLQEKLHRSPGEPPYYMVSDGAGTLLGTITLREGFYIAAVHDGRAPHNLGQYSSKEEAQSALTSNGGARQKQAHERFFTPKDEATIESIERKHFTSGQTGSKFTKGSMRSLMATAVVHRGSLEGDDREALIRAGASSESFLPPESGVRYLMAPAEGIEYLKSTAAMEPHELLYVRGKSRSDGKTPSLSFSAKVSEGEPTKFATIIIGPEIDANNEPIPGTEIIWTAHPGAPVRGIRSDLVREAGFEDGDSLTVEEFRRAFGRDIKVNAELG